MMAGWAYLPRLVDKIRLNLAGRLHADYQPNFLSKGFDKLWFDRSGVKPDELVAVVKASVTDGEVCDWVAKNTKGADAARASHRDQLFATGSEDDTAIRDRLKLRKSQAGLAHRDDIQTFVDFIDADEKRI